MPAISLRGMDVEALLTLRGEIDKRLGEKRSELEKFPGWALKAVRALAVHGAVARQ